MNLKEKLGRAGLYLCMGLMAYGFIGKIMEETFHVQAFPYKRIEHTPANRDIYRNKTNTPADTKNTFFSPDSLEKVVLPAKAKAAPDGTRTKIENIIRVLIID